MKFEIHHQLLLLIFLNLFVGCDSEDDPEEPQLPEIVTVTDESEAVITFTSVEISGSIMESDSEIQSYGVVWADTPKPTLEDNVALPEDQASTTSTKRSTWKQSENSFVVKIDDLTPGNSYYFRTFATNKEGTAYGEELSIETQSFDESKWQLTFHHDEDTSWIAHVDFFEDGTAFYTEPDFPGTYDNWGEWSMEDNVLTYDLMPENEGDSYILTGELNEKEMSGTYTFNTNEGMTHRPWTGVLLSSEAEQ